MPTENERKFVLDATCEEVVSQLSSAQYEISQGYLIATRGITVRVRKSVKNSSKVAYFFTLKAPVKNGFNTSGRVIEIEKNIDERDFNDLWGIALNKLEKIRYIVKHADDCWEIDFFKDYRNKTYMCVAEIEMPEDQLEPLTVPDIVKKNLIYKVPLTDARFSNKLLSDARYASDLLQEVSKK